MSGSNPYYWSAARGSAEIDFLFQNGTDVVAAEVKAEDMCEKIYFMAGSVTLECRECDKKIKVLVIL